MYIIRILPSRSYTLNNGIAAPAAALPFKKADMLPSFQWAAELACAAWAPTALTSMAAVRAARLDW